MLFIEVKILLFNLWDSTGKEPVLKNSFSLLLNHFTVFHSRDYHI